MSNQAFVAQLGRGNLATVVQDQDGNAVKMAMFKDFMKAYADAPAANNPEVRKRAWKYFVRERDSNLAIQRAQERCLSAGKEYKGVVRVKQVQLISPGSMSDKSALRIVMEPLYCTLLEFLGKNTQWQQGYYKIRDGRFNGPLVVKLLREVGCGLANLHSLGIVHRDVHINNIMLSKDPAKHDDWEFKLIDLGLARRYTHDNEETAGLKSKPRFSCAPELLNSDPQDLSLNKASDVWGLASLAVRVMSDGRLQQPDWTQGQEPIRRWAPTVAQALRNMTQDESLFQSDVSKQLWHSLADLVHACLDLDWQQRPSAQSIAQKAILLRYCLQGQQVVTYEHPSAETPEQLRSPFDLVITAEGNTLKQMYSHMLQRRVEGMYVAYTPTRGLALLEDDPNILPLESVQVLHLALPNADADNSMAIQEVLAEALRRSTRNWNDTEVVLTMVDEAADRSERIAQAQRRVSEGLELAMATFDNIRQALREHLARFEALSHIISPMHEWSTAFVSRCQQMADDCVRHHAEGTSRLQALENVQVKDEQHQKDIAQCKEELERHLETILRLQTQLTTLRNQTAGVQTVTIKANAQTTLNHQLARNVATKLRQSQQDIEKELDELKAILASANVADERLRQAADWSLQGVETRLQTTLDDLTDLSGWNDIATALVFNEQTVAQSQAQLRTLTAALHEVEQVDVDTSLVEVYMRASEQPKPSGVQDDDGERLKKEYDILRSKMSGVEAERDAVGRQRDRMMEEIAELKKARRSRSRPTEDQNDEVKSLKADMEQLTVTLQQRDEQVAALERQVAQSQAETQAEIRASEDHAAAAQAAQAELEQRYLKLKQQFEQKRAHEAPTGNEVAARGDVAGLQSRVQELEETASAAEAARLEMSDKYKKLKVRYTNKREELQGMKQQAEEQAATVARLQSQLDGILAQEGYNQSGEARAKQELGQVMQQLQQVQHQRDMLQRQMDADKANASQRMHELQQEMRGLVDERNALADRLTQMQSELATAHRQMEHSQAQLQSHQNVVDGVLRNQLHAHEGRAAATGNDDGNVEFVVVTGLPDPTEHVIVFWDELFKSWSMLRAGDTAQRVAVDPACASLWEWRDNGAPRLVKVESVDVVAGCPQLTVSPPRSGPPAIVMPNWMD
eukprot:TRINITY_DN8773_c0_g1_i1.p1 TRINITY_DN8773_c0_g1~~TRINITY_DN8773_c0_g1_i1.p1  ORF type:complete len:1161 (+),score=366.98 TRINITY_DN8773_c0_g1_i1:59-3484(+)